MQATTKWHSPRASFILLTILIAAYATIPLVAQSNPPSSIPDNAKLIERTRIPAKIHPNRELLLWMISPTKHDRGPLAENPYTCPEVTLGSYYSGPTRLSLLDTQSGRVINTIKLISSDAGDVDEFYIPYRIISGSYYLVPGVRKEMEGKPALLKLRDFNGDGIAAETAFFEAEACMGLPTTLVGYSLSEDKVIQYQAKIQVTEIDEKPSGRKSTKPEVKTLAWTDYLFSEKPVQPGHWKYDIDYTGRAGCNDSYDVRYDQARETFVGTLTEMCPPPDDERPPKK
jgi:hypothetical protein